MISCADILLEGTSDDVSTSEIVGLWFACEFGSADIDCRFFDDDGLEFTNDGSVYEICLLYKYQSPRDSTLSRMTSSA